MAQQSRSRKLLGLVVVGVVALAAAQLAGGVLSAFWNPAVTRADMEAELEKLATFRLKVTSDGSGAELLDSRNVALGTQPITLSTFVTKGNINVFAACDRPTVLYSSSRKLLFSNVNQAQVTYMCPFHSAAFPECLALASEAGLVIGELVGLCALAGVRGE